MKETLQFVRPIYISANKVILTSFEPRVVVHMLNSSSRSDRFFLWKKNNIGVHWANVYISAIKTILTGYKHRVIIHMVKFSLRFDGDCKWKNERDIAIN